MGYLSIDDVRKHLNAAVSKAGSQRKFAKDNGISPTLINETLNGKRGPASTLLDIIGVEPANLFVKKKDGPNGKE